MRLGSTLASNLTSFSRDAPEILAFLFPVRPFLAFQTTFLGSLLKCEAVTRLPARLHARPLALGALVLAACRADGHMSPETPVLSNGSMPPCSQLHRLVAEWQDTVGLACGPDLSGLLELRALGDGRLVFHRRYGSHDDVWTMRPDGSFEPEPLPAFQPIERPQLDVST